MQSRVVTVWALQVGVMEPSQSSLAVTKASAVTQVCKVSAGLHPRLIGAAGQPVITGRSEERRVGKETWQLEWLQHRSVAVSVKVWLRRQPVVVTVPALQVGVVEPSR